MKELVDKNKIIETITGSYLYGTNTETSDKDYIGIFIAPEKYYLGLSTVDEVDCSVTSKQENGKNDSDAIDLKYYELRKFVKLAMENNPNILEILFAPKEMTTFISPEGATLLSHADIFPWQGCTQKFLGYAFSQKHKMVIKTDNFTELNEFNDWLNDNVCEPNSSDANLDCMWLSNQLLAELRTKKVPGVKFHEHHAKVGDINISLTDKLSKVRDKVSSRLSKVGNREELYTKYGFDTKFGMHLVRLMLEGKELLQTGRIEFPLKEREMLLDIRNGKWTKEDIISYSDELEKEIESSKMISVLPSKPNYDSIETLLITTIKKYWENS